ncbi:Ppp2r2a protein [Pelomyxa schiedti]|nr:Ppp2r2a protein [Pelomyxa schiedti]
MLDWRLRQIFGPDTETNNNTVENEDIVSCIDFEPSGEYLAAGDNGGRVVVFKMRQENEYGFFHEFQSHQEESDGTHSTTVPEKINQVKFLKRSCGVLYLLTTNDKKIKLWKMSEIKSRTFTHPNKPYCQRIPQVTYGEDTVKTATLKQTFTYSSLPESNINSISLNSDQESFLSSDDRQINWWKFSCEGCFNIMNRTPPDTDICWDPITCATFHPQHCHIFACGSEHGLVTACDLRQSSCGTPVTSFDGPHTFHDPRGGFFTELLHSINDLKFSSNGRYILSRDFLSMKIWDLSMDREPLKTVHLHDHLVPYIYSHYGPFGKFDCSFNCDSTQIIGGMHSRLFQIYSLSAPSSDHAPSFQMFRARRKLPRKVHQPLAPGEEPDFDHIVSQVAFHPSRNILAVSCSNNLFMFHPHC